LKAASKQKGNGKAAAPANGKAPVSLPEAKTLLSLFAACSASASSTSG